MTSGRLVGGQVSPSPNVLPFVAGAGLPRLSITRSGNSVVISWPVPTSNFVLEEASAIVLPPGTMTWSTVATAPVVANGTNTVTLTVGTGNKLFRLRL